MTARQRQHYLKLLSEYYQRTGDVEEWEGTYYLVLQWWWRERWQIEIVDRRTGVIRRYTQSEYCPIEEYIRGHREYFERPGDD